MKKAFITSLFVSIFVLGGPYVSGTQLVGYDATMLTEAILWMHTNDITKYDRLETYRGNNFLRRDEAAKMFVKFDTSINQYFDYGFTAEQCAFTDLDKGHTDLKDMIIESCRLGVFKGSNGIFNPTFSFTQEQAIAVLIRTVVGYQDEINVNYRSENYYKIAQEYRLLTSLNFPIDGSDRKNPITRGDVALLLYYAKDIKSKYGVLEEYYVR